MTQTTVQKKICLLGDFSVGKTSLVRRFVEGRFDEKYLGTIGVKISRKTLSRPYGQMNLLVWDLAGSNGFDTPSEMSYLHGAMGAVVVCDLTRQNTLATFERYAYLIRAINPTASLVFVGNKSDLVGERVVSDVELSAACLPFRSKWFLTSAKTGEQVESTFMHLAEQIEALK
jgi:small GTP-binding protein